ncbi:hypothetical protein PT974_05101 [Cladobotryum mycophilum]|uniref:Uncharacterized protein n=1 Tax=Cladobotryum mycophilum TaxID=491253 RepID=A0ABR0SSB6_9HYPO
MKFTAALVALASVAAAAPNPQGCKPGTYACLPKANGWQVCNTSGQRLPPKTVCKFYQPSNSPYCVPPNFQFP